MIVGDCEGATEIIAQCVCARICAYIIERVCLSEPVDCRMVKCVQVSVSE